MKRTLTQYGKASKIVLIQALVICCLSLLLIFTKSITINGALALQLSLLLILVIYYKKIILETLSISKEEIVLSHIGFKTVIDFSYYLSFLFDLGVFVSTLPGGDSQNFSKGLKNTFNKKFKTERGSLAEILKNREIRRDYKKLKSPQIFSKEAEEELDIIVSTLLNSKYSYEGESKQIIVSDFDKKRLKLFTRIYLSTYHFDYNIELQVNDKQANKHDLVMDESIRIELVYINSRLKELKPKKHKKK